MLFKNKNILVTGASRGIGKKIAMDLCHKGANTFLTARNKEKLNEIIVNYNNAKSIVSDLSNNNDILELSNSEKFYRTKLSIIGFQELFEMNSIDIKYKNNFKLKFTSKGRIDYAHDKTINFIENYKDKFEMSPQENAFLGYDLLLSMINTLYPINKGEVYPPFQGHFNYSDYKQIGLNNGFENKVVKLFEYSDYTIDQIK